MVITVTKDNFDKEVIAAQGKVLVDFWAEWCAPCMMLSPIVDEVGEEVNGVKICKVNCDDSRELAVEYGISAIPCLMLFENGEIADKLIGLVEKEDILNLIK
ncbi:MAG: thioredoxin [Eubacterium sp.]